MTKTKQINVRLEDDLYNWLHELCKEQKVKKTAFMTDLLEAYREGRVISRPRGPDAFPEETRDAGRSSDFPLLIGIPPDPDPLLSDAFPEEAS